MARETNLERYARLQVTETVAIRSLAAREHAVELVVEDFTATWQSNGGSYFRKNGAQRQLDRARSAEACKILADYIGVGDSPAGLYYDLMDEAEVRGLLVREGNRPLFPPVERDQSWVASLPVRSIP